MIGKMLVVMALGAGMAAAQAPVDPKAAVPAKAMAFDVVSIRQVPGDGPGPGRPERLQVPGQCRR